MSSRLCQLAKGALAPFQVKPQVTPLKDGIDSPLHTLHVDKAHHWSGPPPHLDKAPLNRIHRPVDPLEGLRTLEGREQLREIPQEPCHEWRIRMPPPAGEGPSTVLRHAPARCLIDRLGIGPPGCVVTSPGCPERIAELVH